MTDLSGTTSEEFVKIITKSFEECAAYFGLVPDKTKPYNFFEVISFLVEQRDAARDARLRAELMPDDWVLVPIEPNVAMKIAGDNAGFWCGDKWKAMIEAAPKPSEKSK